MTNADQEEDHYAERLDHIICELEQIVVLLKERITPAQKPDRDCSDQPISVLNLSARARSALRSYGMLSVGDVVNAGSETVLRIPNIGKRSLIEIGDALWNGGFIQSPCASGDWRDWW